MLLDIHAHVIPGTRDAVGYGQHRGRRFGPCDDEHARMLETDRIRFKAVGAATSTSGETP